MTLKEIKKASYEYEFKNGFHMIKLNMAYDPNKKIPSRVRMMKGHQKYKSIDGSYWYKY